ncbi:hypothetical protein [Thermodesulfovibrio sp. 3462-1]|uniref:Uncharacterized protein n=1 Tax=Thermodesulfovibrio obliviosus TaxID=3118332 RepID=A0AAU8H0M8_9BACT
MFKKKITIVLTILLLTVPVFAMDTNVDTGKFKKHGKEQSQTQKKTLEQKTSKGRKRAHTQATGTETIESQSDKQAWQDTTGAGAEITLPLEAVFMDRIATLESETGTMFNACKLVTHPLTPYDLGLNVEAGYGIIDAIKAQYYNMAGQNYMPVGDVVDESKIRQYRDCMAFYGAVIAQAYLYLTQDLSSLKASLSRGTNTVVKGIGYDDFVTLANAALDRAVYGGITNKTIKRIYERILQDNSSCVFQGQPNVVKCGSTQITIQTIPQLIAYGIEWYGTKFAGYHGSFKVNRAWSYLASLEQSKTNSKYARWIDEVTKYIEELESQGKTKEATLVRKKAVEIVKSGKQTVSPSFLLSGIH